MPDFKMLAESKLPISIKVDFEHDGRNVVNSGQAKHISMGVGAFFILHEKFASYSAATCALAFVLLACVRVPMPAAMNATAGRLDETIALASIEPHNPAAQQRIDESAISLHPE
eukprot:2452631-Amphidinium_carterae.1